MATGTGIKEKRTAAGMSQAALAKAAGCVTATDISKAERGVKELSPEQLEAVAKALDVTPESLLDPAPAAEENLTDTPVGPTAEETLADAPVKVIAEEIPTDVPVRLTAEEQELLDLYRAADPDKRQLALCILKGTPPESGDLEKILGSMLKGIQPAELVSIVKNMILGSNVADLLAIAKSLVGKDGKGLMNAFTGTSGSGSADVPNGGPTDGTAAESSGNRNIIENPKSFMTFTYLYSVTIYLLLLSFYFWLVRTDIKPEK